MSLGMAMANFDSCILSCKTSFHSCHDKQGNSMIGILLPKKVNIFNISSDPYLGRIVIEHQNLLFKANNMTSAGSCVVYVQQYTY